MLDAHRALLRRAGFACCLSAYGGVVTAGTDPLHLPRIPVSPWHPSPGHFGFELLAMALAAPAGSERRGPHPEAVGARGTSQPPLVNRVPRISPPPPPP